MKNVNVELVPSTASKRKGFAIILVAALAGLLFLLGASLVAISQLQRAAANYDQRTRLARDHARAALEIAIGELQRHAGRDQAVTFLSDADDTHPYWTAAKEGDGDPVWLVTAPLNPTALPPGPDSTLTEPVLLVSKGSAGAQDGTNQGSFDVEVPKEPINVFGVSGFAADAPTTVGHIGYWVGDLGVKASYALYDKTDRTNMDDASLQRIRQMRLSRPNLIDLVDTGEVIKEIDEETEEESIVSSNPQRIDNFTNDFQFRDRFGDGPEFFLTGLSQSEVMLHFHDFTPLSRGLLVDPVNGGFKYDLSAELAEGDVDPLDESVRAFANLPRSLGPTQVNANGYRYAYNMAASENSAPSLRPMLSQFNLRTALWVELSGAEEEQTGSLKIAHNIALEFWNPYTCTLIQTGALRVKVRGLPAIAGTIEVDGTTTSFELNLDSPVEIEQPEYVLQANEDDTWAPGEIRFYSGGVSTLLPSITRDETSYWTSPINPDHEVSFEISGAIGESDQISCWFQSACSPQVELYLEGEGIVTLLGAFGLDSLVFSDPVSGSEVVVPMTETAEEGLAFAFGWEIDDGALSSDTFSPTSNSIDLEALVAAEHLYQFESNAAAIRNTNMPFPFASVRLLGVKSEFDEVSYDIPIAEIPRQELVSVGGLRTQDQLSIALLAAGDPSSPLNDLFDSAFFSTVDKTPSNEVIPPYVLLNTHYKPVSTSDMRDLQTLRSAAGLWVEGAFNVNSTSTKAWKAILGGVNLADFSYVVQEPVDDENPGESFAVNTADLSATFQYFNFNQSAPETYAGFFDDDIDISQKRRMYRHGLINLSDVELETLATKLVARVRERINSDPINPFDSLQEFVDSGVLQGAIDDAGINDSRSTDFGTPRNLTQRTVLSAINPYLASRSDTFLIRAYGDAVNPANASEVWTRAYCEAIVQRVHRKHETDESPNDIFGPTSTENGDLGRVFEVVAFRWLSPSEI